MGTAIALRNVIGKGEDLLVITVVPFERDIDTDVTAFAMDRDRRCNKRRLRFVEILDEGRDAAFIVKLDGLFLGVAGIGEMEADAGIEEGQFAKTMLQLAEIKFDDLEGGRAGQEGDTGAALSFGRRADDLQRRLGIAVAETHPVFLTVTPDGELKPFAERVDH